MQIQCTFDNRQTCPFISSRPLSAKRSPTGSATSRGKAGAAGEALSLGRAEQRLEGSAEGPPCPVLPPGRQTCPRPQSCHGGAPVLCALAGGAGAARDVPSSRQLTAAGGQEGTFPRGGMSSSGCAFLPPWPDTIEFSLRRCSRELETWSVSVGFMVSDDGGSRSCGHLSLPAASAELCRASRRCCRPALCAPAFVRA